MRICYIADAGSIHTKKWVNFFAERGDEIHLVSPRAGEGYPKSVQCHLLKSPFRRPSLISGYVNAFAWAIQTRQLIKRIKPDIIDAHYINIYGYLAIASRFHPVVLTAWGSDILVAVKRRRLYKFLTQFALKRAELITCDGENMIEEMIRLGAESRKIRLIYHGVDTKKYSPQQDNKFRDSLGLRGVPVVISTRNLEPVYDVETLIRAIPIVLEQVKQANFIIVGDGEQRGYLENLATSLGVRENVRFIGWVTQEELPKYLAASDIYVSTSLSDSISISLLEAMACELPVVITNSGDSEKWVEDGKNGFIVSTSAPDKLAEKIIYLLRKPNIRKEFARGNRKIVEEKSNYEKEMGKMATLYQELIRRQR